MEALIGNGGHEAEAFSRLREGVPLPNCGMTPARRVTHEAEAFRRLREGVPLPREVCGMTPAAGNDKVSGESTAKHVYERAHGLFCHSCIEGLELCPHCNKGAYCQVMSYEL